MRLKIYGLGRFTGWLDRQRGYLPGTISALSLAIFRRMNSEVPAIFLENMPWPSWKVENGGHMWALIWVLHGLIKSYLKISENDRKNTGTT